MDQQVIAGRFEVTGPFGTEGGPGLRVRDRAWQADAVLWALPDGPDAQATAQGLGALRHPGLVPVVDAVDDAGRWYVATQLPPGSSLRESAGPAPLPPWQVARHGREILAVLRALHEAGLHAPGLSPAALFAAPPDGHLVLAGFSGPAEPEFTAPERRGDDAPGPSAAADLWSLGMVLRVLAQGSTAPGEDGGPLAPVLDALLAADPAERPDAARAEALLAEVQLRTAPPPPPPPPSPVPVYPAPAPAPRRSPATLALIVVAAAIVPALVAAAVVVAVTGDDEDGTAGAGPFPTEPGESGEPAEKDGSGGDGMGEEDGTDNDGAPGEEGSGERDGSDGSDGQTAPEEIAVPEHASGPDGLTIALGEPDAPHTLVVYEEPRCPHCAVLEEEIGAEIDNDVREGTYRVEFVIGTFLDDSQGGSGSMNALSALGAALDVSPEAFRDYQRLLYSAQLSDAASNAFESDDRLLEIASSVPALAADEQFAADVTGDTYALWAEAMSGSFFDAWDVTGTPTLRFDGEIVPTPESLSEFRDTIDELTAGP